jgi:glycosyltransferase involved in cell wall biosynthesis
MNPFIMIDGMNLSLEKGTGVATYARNLSYCLSDLGCEVGVLYGGMAAPGISSLLKEIAFFDPNVGRPPNWLMLIRDLRECSSAWNGFSAEEVIVSGTVIYDTYKARLPYFDSLWNSQDLFHRANRAFKWYKALTKVRLNTPPDLMHWTYPIPLRMRRTKNIYTLHDMVPLRLPFTTLDNKKSYYRRVSKIAQQADHIVTVSESARKDIINILGVPEERITNTYQAVSIPEKYRNKPEDVLRREIEGTFGLKYREYFLSFGSIEPKKNIGRMIEAYLGSGLETPLVIVGAQAWKSEQELRLLDTDHIKSLVHYGKETRVKRKVIQLEYAPFPLLVSLIRGAKATFFPSLYEGFGLPVLESMLLRTPVLSSNTSSIPEVAGDAALLINPYDTREMAEAMRRLDSDEELRNSLVAKGEKQVLLYSEEKYRSRLAELYGRILGPKKFSAY